MDNINLLKKYAHSYLSKYNTTKKNLELILINKVMRMENLRTSEKYYLYKIIKQIVEDLVSNKIIDDEHFASTKIITLVHQGKSEVFIKNSLLKKGVNNKIINKLLENFENKNPNWKIDSAIKFVNKKKLGKYGNTKNKEKDLAKMARAGFNYQIALKALGFD